jgi:hypothetical protein
MSSDVEDNQYDNLTYKNNTKNKKWKKIANKKKKRTKSKISSSIERSFGKENDNEDTQNTSTSSDNNLENFSMVFITINLVIGEGIKSINLLVSNQSKIENVIERAIKEFNNNFEKENVLFRLKKDICNYCLKPSKKNGFPKSDMPSFNNKSTIQEVNFNNFTIIWKENPKDFKIYFSILKGKEKKLCNDGCNII